jgi:type III pantothenate kinase
MVDGLVRRIEAELAPSGGGAPTVVATGGLAPLIAGIAGRVDEVDPWLTLTGLKAVYDRNAGAVS